jgi:hypothetical protein
MFRVFDVKKPPGPPGVFPPGSQLQGFEKATRPLATEVAMPFATTKSDTQCRGTKFQDEWAIGDMRGELVELLMELKLVSFLKGPSNDMIGTSFASLDIR